MSDSSVQLGAAEAAGQQTETAADVFSCSAQVRKLERKYNSDVVSDPCDIRSISFHQQS